MKPLKKKKKLFQTVFNARELIKKQNEEMIKHFGWDKKGMTFFIEGELSYPNIPSLMSSLYQEAMFPSILCVLCEDTGVDRNPFTSDPSFRKLIMNQGGELRNAFGDGALLVVIRGVVSQLQLANLPYERDCKQLALLWGVEWSDIFPDTHEDDYTTLLRNT